MMKFSVMNLIKADISETLGLDHFPGLGLGLKNTHFPGLGIEYL